MTIRHKRCRRRAGLGARRREPRPAARGDLGAHRADPRLPARAAAEVDDEPFALPIGATVADLADRVHHELGESCTGRAGLGRVGAVRRPARRAGARARRRRRRGGRCGARRSGRAEPRGRMSAWAARRVLRHGCTTGTIGTAVREHLGDRYVLRSLTPSRRRTSRAMSPTSRELDAILHRRSSRSTPSSTSRARRRSRCRRDGVLGNNDRRHLQRVRGRPPGGRRAMSICRILESHRRDVRARRRRRSLYEPDDERALRPHGRAPAPTPSTACSERRSV